MEGFIHFIIHPVFLPESAGTDKAKIRIRHLLTHTSGYPDHRPYYLQLESAFV